MDLVLLISAVGTAFAIARGPITKHYGGLLIKATEHICKLSGLDYSPVKDPNEDIQRVSDANELNEQVLGRTSNKAFANQWGEGFTVGLAGDDKDTLDQPIADANLDTKYAGSALHQGVRNAPVLGTPKYDIPKYIEPLRIPVDDTS